MICVYLFWLGFLRGQRTILDMPSALPTTSRSQYAPHFLERAESTSKGGRAQEMAKKTFRSARPALEELNVWNCRLRHFAERRGLPNVAEENGGRAAPPRAG